MNIALTTPRTTVSWDMVSTVVACVLRNPRMLPLAPQIEGFSLLFYGFLNEVAEFGQRCGSLY